MLLAPITNARPLPNSRNQLLRWKAHQVSAAASSTTSKTLTPSTSVSTTKGPQAAAKMKKVVAPPLYLAKTAPRATMAATRSKPCRQLTQNIEKYKYRKTAVASKV